MNSERHAALTALQKSFRLNSLRLAYCMQCANDEDDGAAYWRYYREMAEASRLFAEESARLEGRFEVFPFNVPYGDRRGNSE